MPQSKNIGLSILGGIVMGMNFGFWQENVFASLFMELATYYAFMFRYDTD